MYESFIMIAADNINKLRRSDVYRVLSEAPINKRSGLAKWIQKERPDLAEEVSISLLELK